MSEQPSPLEMQVADALRRARKLPLGPDRNDLRQLAVGLLWLHRNGMQELEKARRNWTFVAPNDGAASDPA